MDEDDDDDDDLFKMLELNFKTKHVHPTFLL